MKLKAKPLISVVIATLGRTQYLEKCLTAMLANTYDKYEIIIVDQGRDEKTKKLIDQRFAFSNKVKYVHTNTVGLSHARNIGWKIADGDIIAFIDDDAIPVKRWLEAYADVFSKIEPQPALVGGKIEPVWEVERPKWYPIEREFLLGAYDIGDEIKSFPEAEFPIGANFAILRIVIEEFGGFDDRVGFNESKRKSMIAGEDTLMGLRARNAGYTIIYQPDAKVYHNINANKLSRRYFLRRHYWEGVTQITLEECQRNLGNLKLTKIFFWHIKKVLKEAFLISNYIFFKSQIRSPKPMLHLSMIFVSVGICVKSLQLLFSKKY